MIGILSGGGHVPRYRLSGKALGAVWGVGSGGERAVANYDEDSLTMSCEAALNALHGRDIKNIGACFLASTSAPYAEKSSAAILATAKLLTVSRRLGSTPQHATLAQAIAHCADNPQTTRTWIEGHGVTRPDGEEGSLRR